mgnify:CR=1 FL=1
MLRLIVRNGAQRGRRFDVDQSETLVLGRGQDRGRLTDSRVSRRHARLAFTDDGWVVEDLGSTNGTCVNRRLIATPTPLEVGDLLQLGRLFVIVDAITDPQPRRRGGPTPKPQAAEHFDAAARLPLPVPGATEPEDEGDDEAEPSAPWAEAEAESASPPAAPERRPVEPTEPGGPGGPGEATPPPSPGDRGAGLAPTDAPGGDADPRDLPAHDDPLHQTFAGGHASHMTHPGSAAPPDDPFGLALEEAGASEAVADREAPRMASPHPDADGEPGDEADRAAAAVDATRPGEADSASSPASHDPEAAPEAAPEATTPSEAAASPRSPSPARRGRAAWALALLMLIGLGGVGYALFDAGVFTADVADDPSPDPASTEAGATAPRDADPAPATPPATAAARPAPGATETPGGVSSSSTPPPTPTQPPPGLEPATPTADDAASPRAPAEAAPDAGSRAPLASSPPAEPRVGLSLAEPAPGSDVFAAGPIAMGETALAGRLRRGVIAPAPAASPATVAGHGDGTGGPGTGHAGSDAATPSRPGASTQASEAGATASGGVPGHGGPQRPLSPLMGLGVDAGGLAPVPRPSRSDASGRGAAATPAAPPVPADTGATVYLADASGSMIDSMASVVALLRREIAALPDGRRFAVIFFRDGRAIDLASDLESEGPLVATEASRARVIDWLSDGLHVQPRGVSDVDAAFDAALAYRPDRLVVVSDNRFGVVGDTATASLDTLADRLNERGVEVEAVQMFYRGGRGLLEQLAVRTGGGFRFIEPEKPRGDPAEVLLR